VPKIKVKGQMVQTGECPLTNGWTDAIKRIIAPATRLIKIKYKKMEINLSLDGFFICICNTISLTAVMG